MLDLGFLPRGVNADVQTFVAPNIAGAWRVLGNWQKPRGASMVYMLVVGAGGDGGNGAVGAASAAAGGGGGGSGGQSTLLVAAEALPQSLYVLFSGGAVAVSIEGSNFAAANTIIYANQGSNGGNASGGTGGTGGAAGGAATVANAHLAGLGQYNFLAGHAGGAGGASSAGANLSQATNSVAVTGGTGGGGVNASTWTYGGAITLSGPFPQYNWDSSLGEVAGGNGYQPVQGVFYFYGGLGGRSSHPFLGTTPGNDGLKGGAGAFGCGGGGGGGGITGMSAGTGGPGGPGLIIIAAW